MVRARLCLTLLAGAACDTGWKPASVVESLRVIGLRAEPPEVKPGQTARLSSLLLDPTRPGQKNTVLWLGCEPDPFGEGRGACSDTDVLSNPASFADAQQLPPGVRIIGFDSQAGYSAAPTLFDVLAPTDLRRQLGTVGLVVQMAIGADVPLNAGTEQLSEVLSKVASRELASQLTLFRVRVSESDTPNRNPFIDELLVEGQVLPRGATLPLSPYLDHELDVAAHDFEEYDEVTPDAVTHKTERIVVAWYSTAGRFTPERVAVGEAVKTKLTAPGDPTRSDLIPDDRRGTLWAVARDSRGGQTWRSWPWFVCDPALPPPSVSAVDRGGARLELRGDDLEQILDVLGDDGAVRGAYSPTSRTWVGDPDSGPLTVRAKNCQLLPVP